MVVLGPVGRDLKNLAPVARPDGSESLALGPDGVSPSLDQGFDLVRKGIGGQVEVGLGLHGCRSVEQGIAHRATDEVDPVPGRHESLDQRRRVGHEAPEALRNVLIGHLFTVVVASQCIGTV